jgi:hypothetical protein
MRLGSYAPLALGLWQSVIWKGSSFVPLSIVPP